MRTRNVWLLGAALSLIVLALLTTAIVRRGALKAPDIATLGDVLQHTPVIPSRTELRTTAVTERPLDADGPESAAELLSTLRRRGWTPTRIDCSGDPPCRPSEPRGQVFVDRDGVYLRVCRIGVDDGTSVNDAAPRARTETGGRDIGCSELIAEARRSGADDGQVAFVLEYPRFGVGRWSN